MTRAAVYGRQSHGKKKPIGDQLKLGLALVSAEGWTLAGTYSDAVGASTYSTKKRDDWTRVQAAVAEGSLDVLVLWEPSRGDRKPEEWLAFLRSCKDNAVALHILTDERAYDPRKSRDWKTLASAGIDSAYEVDVMSERARRGLRQAAEAGAPPTGRAPYGYRRVYDAATGEGTFAPDGTKAELVREVIARLAEAEPIRSILRDLEARGIPGPTGKGWYRHRLRLMGLNVAYIGVRDHKGTLHPGDWPALVDEATFYAARRALTEDARMASGKHARPGRQVHLLSYYATCTTCDQTVRAFKDVYSCLGGHVWIKREKVDDLISELAVARLADPDLYTALRSAGEASHAVVSAARNEAATLQAQLDGWRTSAALGETTPASLAAIEPALQARIDAAHAKAQAAAVPLALQGWAGGPAADVAARWAVAPVQARRSVLRALGLAVAVQPAGGRTVPVHERVAVTWA